MVQEGNGRFSVRAAEIAFAWSVSSWVRGDCRRSVGGCVEFALANKKGDQYCDWNEQSERGQVSGVMDPLVGAENEVWQVHRGEHFADALFVRRAKDRED
jgi:hypothetical protein